LVGLIVAFGPMFWMMPSRRERTLMRMRNRARALGILVELIEIDDPFASADAQVTASGRVRAAKLSGVAYRLPFLRPLTLAPAWAINRAGDRARNARAREEAGIAGKPAPTEIAGEPVAHPPHLPTWRFRQQPEPGDLDDDRYWQDIARVLGNVSEDVFSCEAHPHAASFLWRERVVGIDPEAGVERLVERLREFADLQRMRHVARETEFERQGPDDPLAPRP